jgi:rhamnosyl/mannosyltransferase
MVHMRGGDGEAVSDGWSRRLLKILHLGKFFPPAKGGMETVLALLCEKTSGHVENRAIVAGHSSRTVVERHAGVEVVRAGCIARVGAVAVCPSMPALLGAEDADLVVIHEPNPMGLLAYYLVRPAVPLIVWFHSEVIRPGWQYRSFYRPLLQFALRRAAKIVVASPTLAESAPALREWQAKCVVIPYGIGIDTSSPEVARRSEALQRAARRPVVLFVGRLVPYKGADVLLDAMQGLNADAVLVGDGPMRQRLESKARELGISDQIRFAGELAQDELTAQLLACDLLVLPSVTRQEAFGVVQLEAMACGKPVISTDLGTGVGWVNQHGETGLVVPPGEAAALRDAIRILLEDAPRRAALGEGARRRARSHFHVDHMVDSTLGLYTEVARRHVSHVA